VRLNLRGCGWARNVPERRASSVHVGSADVSQRKHTNKMLVRVQYRKASQLPIGHQVSRIVGIIILKATRLRWTQATWARLVPPMG
jgi:predicted type IV restriction endonuclease